METTSDATSLGSESVKSSDPSTPSRRLWAGRIIGGLPALFLLTDGAMKLFKPDVVVEATKQLGYPESAIVGLGLVLLACTLLYLIPGTAVLGAVLLTGYLGGAAASQVRVGAPPFNVVFAVTVGVLLWAGLWLRDRLVQQVLPLRHR